MLNTYVVDMPPQVANSPTRERVQPVLTHYEHLSMSQATRMQFTEGLQELIELDEDLNKIQANDKSGDDIVNQIHHSLPDLHMPST